MRELVHTASVVQASPRARARITGVVYLLFFATAVASALVSPGTSGLGGALTDAAATANAILAHRAAYQLGWALGMVSNACYVALIALFYQLFRPVSSTAALLAAFFGLLGCAVNAVGSLLELTPLLLLGGDPYLGAFTREQLQAQALVLLNLSIAAGSVALVFFGVFQLALGYVIFRSGFLPRILGVLVALAGVGWLTFLAPPLASRLLPELEVLGIVAEAGLMLWLLVAGVNAQAWLERSGASAPTPASR